VDCISLRAAHEEAASSAGCRDKNPHDQIYVVTHHEQDVLQFTQSLAETLPTDGIFRELLGETRRNMQ
jgi:hypothetical protein